MDITGNNNDNVHNGNTLIEGNLSVEGQLFIGDSKTTPEYLDSGVYTPTITTITPNWSFNLSVVNNSEPVYEKNGNVVSLCCNILAGWTTATTSFASFSITVPSLDLFDLPVTNKAWASAGIKGIYSVSRVTKTAGLDNSFDIELNAENPFSLVGSGRFSLILTYKLDAPDVPASVIVQGGGGGGSEVRNPMLENLNGGGYSILNIDGIVASGSITANTITASNVVTNPLTTNLDTAGFAITNVSNISSQFGDIKFGGSVLRDVQEVNNSGTLLIDGNTGLNLGSLSGTVNMLTNVDFGTYGLFNSSLVQTNLIEPLTGSDLDIKALSIGANVNITANNIFSSNSQALELKASGGSVELRTNGEARLASAGGRIAFPSGGTGVIFANTQFTILAPIISMTASGGTSIGGGNLNMLTNGIENCTTLNGLFLINQESDFPNPLEPGVYRIQSLVTLTQPLVLTGDTTFKGDGRDNAGLEFKDTTTLTGYCIDFSDYNVEFQNMKLCNQSTNIDFINASNAAQDKFLLFTNCFITDSKNAEVINILGFDLVDFNQCLFMFNYTTAKHLYVSGASKLQLSSCEFLRQFDQGTGTWGAANMVDLYGAMGAVNISGCLFHAQQTQIGLYIDNAQTALENVVAANTFISIGQTTGANTSYDISLHPELVVSTNSGVLNEKALVEGSVEGNTSYTATVSGSYVSINVPTITFPALNRFTTATGVITYAAKQPIQCLINANILANQGTGGNDTCRFGLEKNGTLVSSIGILVEQNTDRSFSYTAIVPLEQNDTLEFVCQNITAGTDAQGFRVVDLNASLIEV